MSRQGRVALAAASGLLLFAAFPPLDLGALAWIALVPLLLAIDGLPPPRAFLAGWIAGGVAFLSIVAWMRVFGFLAWVLLGVYLGLYVGVFAALHRWMAAGRAPWVAAWTAALLWTVLEYLRAIGATGFPWALLGLTQYRAPAVIQVAKVTGVYGVSFLVALAGGSLAAALIARRLRMLLIPALVIAASVLWGAPQVRGEAPGSLRVAAVQPNIPARVKFDPALSPRHMETLARLVGEAGERGAELIVLPETAVPYNLFGRSGALGEVGAWANRARATLIASSLEDGVSNIAVAVAPSGQAVSRYDKVRLVAFGEYGIRPGRRHEPLWTPLGQVGVAVCFESIFPDVSRALVRNGAEVLAVITNDGWFDGTAGVAQHAAHAVLRAVETGRWVVRAANTGVTMVIDPAGRIRSRAAPGREAVLVDRAGLRRTPTVYAQYGDVFAFLAAVALVLMAAPRLRTALLPEARTPAFQQAAAVIGLPLAAVGLLLARAPAGLWPGVLLAFVVVLSLLRPPREWGFRGRGVGTALLGGGAVVAVLWAGLVLAFRAYDLPTAVPVPPGGWTAGVVRSLIIALAVEGWLRGLVFAPVAEWKGRGAAVAVGTALGMALQRGLGAEAMAWALVTGAAFGLLRARTGNAVGLVIPHAVGNLLFSIVTTVR